MVRVVIGVIALIVGLFALLRPVTSQGAGTPAHRALAAIGGRTGGVLLSLVGLFLLASTSFVLIDANSVGHLKRVYAFQELPPGRVIAESGEKGPQARILGPGFHFEPLIRVLYQIEEFAVINIPQGYYGEITAVDGRPMPEGMFIAPAVPDDKVAELLDAEKFLSSGVYFKGPQETVLRPGSYRINQYLFDVRVATGGKGETSTAATIIPAGHVGVVKSNVAAPGTDCQERKVAAAAGGRQIPDALTVPLVSRGCVGIWREPLYPGAYYLNRRAYEVTLVDTRVQTWEYRGGYNRRKINLSIDQQGNLRQTEESVVESVPNDAADRAVFVKVEGWDIPVELRALVQVDPENAPVVVGSVGGLQEIENRILTPAIRSIVRNVAGSAIRTPVRDADGAIIEPITYEIRPTRVLDLIENREALEQTIEAAIKVEGAKAGVDVKEIRIGEPAIPPELLLSRLRVQLADQLSQAYDRETAAQNKRIETEQARATANEQPRLVQQQIEVKVAELREQERAALGRAERQYLEELARGQLAQANVLGQDRVALLQALEKTLAALERKPELVGLVSRLVPHTVVGGDSGGGMAGAAAILGNAFSRSNSAPAGGN
ncbi:MAG: hypothetical protein GC150_11085 [Rhizobiales bacterium]|nr:hypothetical protein [Hyphomicrobiales bacterium]